MNRRITGLVLGMLALAVPTAAQVTLGAGAAASVTHRGGVALADHGGGWVALDRHLSPQVSVGGELGLVSGAGAYWESQARARIRFTVGDRAVRPYVQYGVGIGRRHATVVVADPASLTSGTETAWTSAVGYAGPGAGVLVTIGTTPWALITGVNLSGPRLGGFTAIEDLRVAVGFVRRLR